MKKGTRRERWRKFCREIGRKEVRSREGGILVESKKWRRKLFHALRMSGVTRLLCAIISESFNKVGKKGGVGKREG